MRDILDRLIAFDSVSHRSNLPLMHWVRDLLADHGIACDLIPDGTGQKANLLAVIGPRDVPGVVVSGHVDVVPVEGQAWSKPPFRLTEESGRLYGRGTTDMKGFVACAIEAAILAARRPLAAPLVLALSHDEEVGCRGVGTMIDRIAESLPPQRFCLVGEPSSGRIAVGHKGKVALRTTCTGRAMHSSCAPLSLNAIHLGVAMVGAVQAEQARAMAEGPFDGDYEVAASTLHVGTFRGGVQVNIVADAAVLDWEIRSLAGDDPGARLDRIAAAATGIVAPLRARFPEAGIVTERLWSYPGLDTAPDAPVVGFLRGLTGDNSPVTKVAFGTEGGMFAQRLGLATAICGPGSMAQGHTPDEWVAVDDLERCRGMLAALVGRLEAGDLG
ncbi:MAG: acetylornithine deacetylase [Gemmobacter sp.]